MLLKKYLFITACSAVMLMSCKSRTTETTMSEENKQEEFQWQIDRFADAKILRYKVEGFEQLSLKQKELIYYLSQAALCGRDITWDQNYKYNLVVRKTLETIYTQYSGDTTLTDWKEFEVYLKRVWLAGGIHHHYSMDKFEPGFSQAFFTDHLNITESLPLLEGQTKEEFINFISDIIFNNKIAAKRVLLDTSYDVVAESATNLYEGVTKDEAVQYYESNYDLTHPQAPEWGLNTKLEKQDNKIIEKIYKLGGMYSAAIEKILHWLSKAETVAENEQQRLVISKLIEYYKSGDVKIFDDYNILWVKDTASAIDFVNGFIEVYGDPIGRKGTWESVVNIKNVEATKRTQLLSDNAQWFEDHSPIDDKFKKGEVKGITAKVINVAMLGGECHPTSPAGINLPNNGWIRKEYGSKSVTLDNIMFAIDQSKAKSGTYDEFCYSDEELQRAKQHAYLARILHVDMHECLGHGSGQFNEGVTKDDLKSYYSTIEEARADLFALYYTMDEKLIDIGLMDNLEPGKAEYDSYIRGGLMLQLKLIELGKDIEESHMRNRQLISKWVYEKGAPENVISKEVKNGKTYFVINDYMKLRSLFGELLKEIQRIKSEGDIAAAADLVETYGVKVDLDLHKEVLARYEKLDLASFPGFANPRMVPMYENDKLIDVTLDYTESYSEQMLRYSEEYSLLPLQN